MQKEAFQTEARAESMVRPLSPVLTTTSRHAQVLAASHLLSITHSIKLLLLLSDEKEIVTQRDAELKHLEEEISETRKLAIQRSEELLR
jgi:mediator of RNA polymerase II transcription subunit 22